jgi:DnaJ-class molecular chaperone
MEKNFYLVLRVSRAASADEIQSASVRLIAVTHRLNDDPGNLL